MLLRDKIYILHLPDQRGNHDKPETIHEVNRSGKTFVEVLPNQEQH